MHNRRVVWKMLPLLGLVVISGRGTTASSTEAPPGEHTTNVTTEGQEPSDGDATASPDADVPTRRGRQYWLTGRVSIATPLPDRATTERLLTTGPVSRSTAFISYKDYPGKQGVGTWKEVGPSRDERSGWKADSVTSSNTSTGSAVEATGIFWAFCLWSVLLMKLQHAWWT